jgi:pimeloyl-ACP methyl ester carboxylesterase
MGIGKSIMTLNGQTTVLLSRLSELQVPTLLVWGAKDSIVPVTHAYAASQLIPDCQLQVFKDCGHSVYKQRVQEFSQLLVRFLG